ncbi:hypothetical protein GQ44DRAFT_824991 [Phaeosphaeriaceae sp. PMI808]|nr:hypothetical protein GQ44DRAFT_824991 [Phaeosphaeriaceae sp. PMI808]
MATAASIFITDFDVVRERSAQSHYDYIIIGSGLGGGILARQLIGGTLGPSQDNDVVFNAQKAKVQIAAGSNPYVGGLVYCLGGQRISKYLLGKNGGYEKAFALLTNNSQMYSDPYPQAPGDISTLEVDARKQELEQAIKRFYKPPPSPQASVEVEIAPVAVQFNSPGLYEFPQGAYSIVDALLDKAYAQDSYMTILLNTEALRVSYHGVTPKPPPPPPHPTYDPYDISGTDTGTGIIKPQSGKGHRHSVSDLRSGEVPPPGYPTPPFPTTYTAESAIVRTTNGEHQGHLSAKKGIVLCAGTIDTARISLNSGLRDIKSGKSLSLIGKGLTDHEIWGVRFVKEKGSQLKAPLELQSVIKVCQAKALLNVVVNANAFFGRSSTFAPPIQRFHKDGRPMHDHNGHVEVGPKHNDTVDVTLEFTAELSDESEVLDIPSAHPVIYARRPTPRSNEACQEEMQRLASEIRNSFFNISKDESLAGFGVVAHEVGTMRMQTQDPGKPYIVDENYRVRNFSNLYVCDLSIFPVSPPANPPLTLAALALQLADDLVKPLQEEKGWGSHC